MASATATPEQKTYDWARVNVLGDGNCFYRSLYEAAKFHTNPDVLGRMLECFGAELGEPLNLATQEVSEAKKEEDDFCKMGRYILAKILRANGGAVLERLVGGVRSPYEVSKEYIETLVPRNSELSNLTPDVLAEVQSGWKTYLSELSEGFQAEFGDIEYFPTSREEFADRYACIIGRGHEFTAELDINLVNTVLAPRNLIVYVLNPNEQRRVINPEGVIPLYVMLDREASHYNFLVAPEIYETHTKVLTGLTRSKPDKVFYKSSELFMEGSERVQDHEPAPVPATPPAPVASSGYGTRSTTRRAPINVSPGPTRSITRRAKREPTPPPSSTAPSLARGSKKGPNNANINAQLAAMGITKNSDLYNTIRRSLIAQMPPKKGGKRRATRKKRRV